MIRVGTAGWSYEDWNGVVYPARPAKAFDRLAFQAALFDASEINSTFYRIPAPRQTRDWARRVASNPRFSFTAKLWRGFTHERDAGDADAEAFLAAMAPLQEEGRLGAILVQFPISFHGGAGNRGLLEAILKRFASLPLAVEFRGAEWDEKETDDVLARHGAAFVNIDQPSLEGNLRATEHETDNLAYFRFHGRNAAKWFGPDTSNEERYNYLYGSEELAPWTARIRKARAKNVFAILNNHFRGQAAANALELQHALTGAALAVPETLREAYPALAAITRPSGGASQKRLF
ncbi:MAG TPA: DUF72 domain-containing protein [Thermoanaerobaculia bacterium]|nr:DUF72 domain-containing protein [Thermoanaerobaculia bacterium]